MTLLIGCRYRVITN